LLRRGLLSAAALLGIVLLPAAAAPPAFERFCLGFPRFFRVLFSVVAGLVGSVELHASWPLVRKPCPVPVRREL